MQLVKDKYYIWYNRLIAGLSSIVLAGVLAARFMPDIELFARLKSQYGFGVLSGILAGIHVLFGFVIYLRFAKRQGAWAASLLSFLIFNLNIVNLVHNTGQMHSWFLVAWAFMVLASGMFGVYTLIGSMFLVTLYFILITTGDQGGQELFDQVSVGALGGLFLLAIISFFGWRVLYVDAESKRVVQLAGQLTSKQQQSAILIQSITDGVIVTDTEGKISLINPAAVTMTEWPVEEATGIVVKSVIKLKTENGEEIKDDQNPFSIVLKQQKKVDQIAQLVGREGKQQTVSIVVSPVLLPNSKELAGTVAVIRDVSEERKAEKQRADFISTASHEMRTPVAAIEGYLALALNEQVSKIDSRAREYLEKAHSSTQHLGNLFQDLLTSAKAEDGRLVSHPVVVEMGAFLEQLTEGLRFAAEKKGLFAEFVIGTSYSKDATVAQKTVRPLYYVFVDPDRMREVITNIFDNAVKYTETGKISIGLTGDDNIVQFYVRDTGPGIPAEDVPHLFQKFYRVDNSATRTVGGTGLGLFICRKIVELYQGRIWVESKLDEGSTFFINLPRLSGERASQLQAKQSSEGSPLVN